MKHANRLRRISRRGDFIRPGREQQKANGVQRLNSACLIGSTDRDSRHLGRNAIYPLARAVATYADLSFDVPTHPLLGDPTLNVGTIAGGSGINLVQDSAEAQIDVRTVPGLTGAAVLEALRAAADPEVTVEPWIDLAPVVTDPDDPWVRSVFEVSPAEPGAASYFTDAAALTPAYGNPPTVIWGPGEAAQAHQTDEWADAAKIDAAADDFTEVARRWCGV